MWVHDTVWWAAQWVSHSSTKLPIGSTTLPLWLTIRPQEDGSYEVLKDPIVQEMLDVFIQRMPDYYELKYKKSLKMPLQTLIHGDFHGGNHMYGTGENYGNTNFKEFRKGVNRVWGRFWFKIEHFHRKM